MSQDSEAVHCPYCYSADVVTSPKPSAASYWRCKACGELWHPDRVAPRDRFGAVNDARRRVLAS